MALDLPLKIEDRFRKSSRICNLYVFNGLGARGILNGNYFSINLYHHLENDEEIHPEVDLKDFNKKIRNSLRIFFCREEGIRTLDTVTRILPFQGSSFNHSDTSLYLMAKVEFILQFRKFLHADFS